jgi:hypothetical protein
LGINRRRVIPVILVPTPPKYFALPRVSTMLPTWGDLLQISHDLDMTKPATLENKANFQKRFLGFPGERSISR